jgi:FAD-linked oxidoreductase
MPARYCHGAGRLRRRLCAPAGRTRNSGVQRSRQRGSTAGAQPGDTWMNWARNQSCVPSHWERPSSEDELAEVVRRAASDGRTVRAVGSGHSYSSIACTDGHLIDLSGYNRVLDADPATGVVTVQAGITLRQLNEELARRGLAMEVLGDIDYQSIAGALSTGTHGPGIRYPTPSARVLSCRIIDGAGTVVECSAHQDPGLWSAARVGLGALGLLSTVTLQTVPAFRLHTVEEPMRMDRVLADLDGLVDGNDHLGMFWFPGSQVALVKRSNRTDQPVAPRDPRRAWLNDVVVDNHLFGAACRVATKVPSVGRAIIAGAGGKGRHEWVDRSDRVFATPRLVRVVEMEYSIPRDAFREAFERLRRLVDRLPPITVPVEIRWTAGDDIPLSHASGRDSAYIAAHMYRGVPNDEYFGGVEAIMADYGGRPHWGKLHFQRAETLAPRYPRWDEFQAVRARMDPDGRFRNPYTDRVLGVPAGVTA